MTREEAVNDLSTIKEFFEQENGAYPVSLEYAIETLKNEPQKVIAQVTFDEEKLREIVKEAVERFKEEYEIVDRPQGEWIEVFNDRHRLLKKLKCSNCGEDSYFFVEDRRDFCSACGARMKGADDE